MFTFFFVLSDSLQAGKHPPTRCLLNRSCDSGGNRALPNILWHRAHESHVCTGIAPLDVE